MDIQAILQGLTISISGMLITFFALGVFIFIMLGLQRIFPPRLEKEEESSEVEIENPVDCSNEEVVVAIVTAVQTLKAKSQSNLGKSLETGPGRLWSSVAESHITPVGFNRRR